MKKLSLMLVFVALFATLLALSAFAAFSRGPEELITNEDVAVDENGEKMHVIVTGTGSTGNWGHKLNSSPAHFLDGDSSTVWCGSDGSIIRITFTNEWEITELKGLHYDNSKYMEITAYAADGTVIAQKGQSPSCGNGYNWRPASDTAANVDWSSMFFEVTYGDNDKAVKYIEFKQGNWCNLAPQTFELFIKGRERIPSVGCTEHVWTEELDPAPTCTEVGTLYRWCEVCLTEDAPKEVPALGHIIGSEYDVTRQPNCQDVGEITFTCTREGCGDLISRALTLDDVTDYANMYSAKNEGAGGNTTNQTIANQLFDGNIDTLLQASGGHFIQSEITLDMPYYISSLTIWTGYQIQNGTNGQFNLTLYVMKPGETEWTPATTAQVAPTNLNDWEKTQHIVEFEEIQASAIKIRIEKMDDYAGFASEAKIRGSVVPNAGGDHVWGEPEVVEPSCDHTGYTKTTCTVCGESKTSDPQPAIEHLWDIPATCTKGTTCSVCENSKNDALGHTEEDIPAVDATCTEAGSTAGKKCTVCGEITVEPQPIEALGHTFGEEPEVTKQATCVSKGVAQYYCEVCGTYDVNEYEVEINPNNHMNAEMNSAYTVSSCPDCGDVSFYNSHMGIDNDYTLYFMGNLVNIYKEGMDEYYAYTKVIDAETGVATLVLSEAFDEETEASRGTTFVGFEASVLVNKDDSLYISLAKDDVTYLFGTDPETIVDNSSALNGTYQYVENDVVIFEFVLEDGKITWTIAGGEENGAEATYTFYGSKFTTAFPLEYVSGWMGDFLLYSRYNPMTGETEEYPLTLKSDEEPEDPEIPEVNYGIEIDPITVVTTDTYNFIDNYTYTALTSGKYTFYFPAGLGLLLPDNYMPEFDFYANENGQYYTVALAEGQTFEFVVGATVKDTWTIAVYYEYAEVEAPEESDNDELVIGKTDIDGKDATYIFTATENGVLTITTENAIMGEVTIVYSVNGGEAQSVALLSSVAINLVAGDEVVITVTAAGYSAFTAAWEKTIPVKDLIVNESSNQVEQSDVIFVYTAPEAGKLTLTTGAAIMGEVVFTYTVNGSEALEFALQSTVELELEAGDVVKVTVIAAGYSSLTATWEADHTHSYSETVTDPTCTDKGYTTYTCTCGDTYVGNYVDATGHKYTETRVESTCSVAGKITYTCACGDSYEETLKLAPHTEVKIPAVLPTPSVTGYTAGVKCSDCGETLVAPKEINVTDMADTRDPNFRVAAASLTLMDSIVVNYKSVVTKGYNNPYMVFVFKGEEYMIESSGVEAGTGRLIFDFDKVEAHWMNENIEAYVYAETAEGEYSRNMILEYSVKNYAINQLKKNDAALTTVISDLLVMGAKTQLYTGYKTNELVTDVVEAAGYTLTPTAFTSVDESYNIATPVTGDRKTGTDWKSGAVYLGSRTVLQLKFATDDVDTLVVKVTVGNKTETYTKEDFDYEASSGRYVVNVDFFSAKQYGTPVVGTFERNGEQVGSTITYSVNAYAYRNANTTSGKTQDLIKALYVYGQSVAVYFK